MKININLKGGLGNQMFQYAFGYSLQKKYNSQLYFSYNQNDYRKYMLNIFGIDEKKINTNDFVSIKYNGSYSQDKFFPYDILDTTKNYDIEGFFQNENYFSNIKEEIKNIFKLNNEIKINENTLVVHVRRTDYTSNPDFSICDKNWYIKAISTFKNIEDIIFVSDDTSWCQENFSSLLDKKTFFPILNEVETLGLLQHAHKIVISNSSFGWWGAWLSNTNNVVMPNIWYKKDITWDLGCENWLRL